MRLLTNETADNDDNVQYSNCVKNTVSAVIRLNGDDNNYGSAKLYSQVQMSIVV